MKASGHQPQGGSDAAINNPAPIARRGVGLRLAAGVEITLSAADFWGKGFFTNDRSAGTLSVSVLLTFDLLSIDYLLSGAAAGADAGRDTDAIVGCANDLYLGGVSGQSLTNSRNLG